MMNRVKISSFLALSLVAFIPSLLIVTPISKEKNINRVINDRLSNTTSIQIHLENKVTKVQKMFGYKGRLK